MDSKGDTFWYYFILTISSGYYSNLAKCRDAREKGLSSSPRIASLWKAVACYVQGLDCLSLARSQADKAEVSAEVIRAWGGSLRGLTRSAFVGDAFMDPRVAPQVSRKLTRCRCGRCLLSFGTLLGVLSRPSQRLI